MRPRDGTAGRRGPCDSTRGLKNNHAPWSHLPGVSVASGHRSNHDKLLNVRNLVVRPRLARHDATQLGSCKGSPPSRSWLGRSLRASSLRRHWFAQVRVGLGSRRPWQAHHWFAKARARGVGPSPQRSEYVPKAAPYPPGLALGGRGRPPSLMRRRDRRDGAKEKGQPLPPERQRVRSGVSMSRRQLHTLRAWLSAAVAGRADSISASSRRPPQASANCAPTIRVRESEGGRGWLFSAAE